jgi:lipopolysaccharide export system ATP-binding protein
VARRSRIAASALSVRLAAHWVLRDVNLAVGAGEVVGIFGPSGAGKSTLFRALAGEERLARGSVWLKGEDVTAMPLWRRARRGLGYLPQTPSVLWELSVAENLAVFERLARRDAPVISPRDTSSALRSDASLASPRDASSTLRSGDAPATGSGAQAIARDLGLEERIRVKAGSLSGGERRRLELARALCGSPRVLLCDEPFAAVDPAGAAKVSQALSRLAASGAAVLIADHHVAEALRLCHRAALLLDGQIALVAEARAFSRHELVRKHYTMVEVD